MRSQMLEAASSLVHFVGTSRKPKEEIARFKNTVVRLFSLWHAMTMCVIADQQEDNFPIIDVESIPDRYLAFLKAKALAQKPELVVQWINHTIIKSLDVGLLNVPAPILSRVFQQLEKATVEYSQVVQVKTIAFPFPYAQVSVIMVWFYLLFTPFIMTAWTEQPVMAMVFTFLSSTCLMSLEMIAAELENPFGKDINDLPCHVFQDALNEGLLLLIDPAASVDFELNTNYATHRRLSSQTSWRSFDEECKSHHIEAPPVPEYSDSEHTPASPDRHHNMLTPLDIDSPKSRVSGTLLEEPSCTEPSPRRGKKSPTSVLRSETPMSMMSNPSEREAPSVQQVPATAEVSTFGAMTDEQVGTGPPGHLENQTHPRNEFGDLESQTYPRDELDSRAVRLSVPI